MELVLANDTTRDSSASIQYQSSHDSVPLMYLADANGSQSTQALRIPKHPAIFRCNLCPKKFTRAYNLRSHLRTHTDEKIFKCNVCSKGFARQHDRKRHEGLHSGPKKFICKGTLEEPGQTWGCGRRFARADALGRHFRSEAGRVCIKPLLDEEVAERQRLAKEQSFPDQNSAQNIGPIEISVDGTNNLDLVLPESLFQQYPDLREISWVGWENTTPDDPSLLPLSLGQPNLGETQSQLLNGIEFAFDEMGVSYAKIVDPPPIAVRASTAISKITDDNISSHPPIQRTTSDTAGEMREPMPAYGPELTAVGPFGAGSDTGQTDYIGIVTNWVTLRGGANLSGESPATLESNRISDADKIHSRRRDSGTSQDDATSQSLEPQKTAHPVRKHAALYLCELCPKRFTRKFTLQAHLRNHTGSRPFACAICSREFTRKHDLNMHKQTHANHCGKLVYCRFSNGMGGCGKVFTRASNLARHRRGPACCGPHSIADKEGADRDAAVTLATIARGESISVDNTSHLSTHLDGKIASRQPSTKQRKLLDDISAFQAQRKLIDEQIRAVEIELDTFHGALERLSDVG